jgi:hypothetical protein
MLAVEILLAEPEDPGDGIRKGRVKPTSLRLMADIAGTAYGREQVPISPEVFWWRDGDWMPVPSEESDGKLILRPGPELSFLLTDLAARPHPSGFT